MGRLVSDATALRNVKSELSKISKELYAMSIQMAAHRARATKAEQECAEWKARFDILLRRDGVSA